MNIQKKDFDYCCSVEDLSAVGIGYTLYFKLTMNLKYLMFVLCIFHSSITFYLNYTGTFCKPYNPIDALNHNLCEANIFNNTSLANRVDEEMRNNWQVYIDGAFFYVLLASLFIIRLNLYYQVNRIKERRGLALNDFSVFCYNLPKMGLVRLRVLLLRYFKNLNLNNGISYELESINFCVDNREYLQLISQKDELDREIKERRNKLYPGREVKAQQKTLRLQDKYNQVTDKLDLFAEKVESCQFEYNDLFTRKGFLTFKIYGAAHDILGRYSEDFFTTNLWRKTLGFFRGEKLEENGGKQEARLHFEGEDLKILPAVYPSNFIWENAGVGNLEKFMRRGSIFVIEFVLFLICFYIITLVAEYQIALRRKMLFEQVEESVRSRQFVIMQLIAVGTTFILIGVNKVTAIMLRYLVFYEKHEKKTSMDSSIAEKLSLHYFINSSLTLFLIHYYYDNVWKYGRLVYLAAFFMATNFLAKIVSCYIDVWYIFKSIQKWYFMKYRPKVDQATLNRIFEDNEFDFASYTASILSAVYHCFFYSSMVPIVGIANVITQVCEYYLHKYVIIERCSSKKKFGDTLLVQILNYVDLSLIFYAAGTMGTYYIFINQIPFIYWINLFISILYNLLPLNLITRKLMTIKKEMYLKRYKDYRHVFDSENYNLYNPVKGAGDYYEMDDLSV